MVANLRKTPMYRVVDLEKKLENVAKELQEKQTKRDEVYREFKIENQRKLDAEERAYNTLRDAYENKVSESVIWDDPRNENVRYYGEVETWFHGRRDMPVLSIFQDFGDGTLAETKLSKQTQSDWLYEIEGDIADAEEWADEWCRTQDYLNENYR